MSKIKEIYDELYSDINTKNPRFVIDYYELNKSLIEKEDCVLSNPDYDGIMRLTADYALALSHYGSSRKSIPYLDKSIQLFRDSSSEELLKIPMYEMLIWTRGVENYNQKRYSLASKDFKYLVNNYPENDKYRNWLLGSKTIYIRKYLNTFWWTAVLFMIWESLIGKQNTGIKHYLFILGIFFTGLAVIGEIVILVIKRNVKK